MYADSLCYSCVMFIGRVMSRRITYIVTTTVKGSIRSVFTTGSRVLFDNGGNITGRISG